MINDDAYANTDYIPEAASYLDLWEIEAREFREVEAAIGRARLNTAYGPGERQRFDLFHPAGKAEGLVVFIHGGYWRRFDRTMWSHFSAGCTARGWAVAMPSYTLAPEARISEITKEVARAIEAAAGFVRGPIRLMGHSAGGHLAARMLCTDVAMDSNVRARLCNVVPISPVTDLRPLLETTLNLTLRLDENEAAAESPALLERHDMPATVWVGTEERPAFLDQARWLSDAWDVPWRVAPGRHHFDILDDLRDPDSPIVRTLFADPT